MSPAGDRLMREVRIGDWLLQLGEKTKCIHVISPRTGPGFTTVMPEATRLQDQLLYALAKELIDTMGHERT